MTRKIIRKTDKESIVNISKPGYNENQKESKIKKPIKDFKDLDISDNFMFSAVMRDPELCKELLERILNVEIERLDYSEREKLFGEKPDTKSVRLDVYVKDGKGTVYDVEMQTTDPGDLPLRSRYYQVQNDASLLAKGADYKVLNKSFVIFICMKDIFEQGRPIYTFESRCIQDTSLALKDNAAKIFLNPHAKMDGVSTKLANFLNFLVDGKPVDKYTERLVEAVETAKNNEYLGVEYMSMLANQMDVFRRGKAEGIIHTVKDMGGTVESASQMLVKQCGMEMEEALEKAKQYW